jgi:hypothetical protein
VTQTDDPPTSFIKAACVPLDSWHASGTLERAEAILAAHPEVKAASIHTAAVLGDDAAVRRFLGLDPAAAAAKGGPYNWDALTHLCFSRYLRLEPARSVGFVRAATALLDAGASANTGWYETNHQPHPEWESVLYGAAGIAHHGELTGLLLERGADPNDGEVTYHTPESSTSRGPARPFTSRPGEPGMIPFGSSSNAERRSTRSTAKDARRWGWLFARASTRTGNLGARPNP